MKQIAIASFALVFASLVAFADEPRRTSIYLLDGTVATSDAVNFGADEVVDRLHEAECGGAFVDREEDALADFDGFAPTEGQDF